MSKSAIGYEFERQLVREFKDRGFVTIRSAASKTIDVIALDQDNIYLIEAKRTRQSKPRSYGEEIYELMLMRRKLKRKDVTFLFWIRLRWKKDLVLRVSQVGVDVCNRFTTCDMELANKFCKRKNKGLKRK